MQDASQRFSFEKAPVRGQLVHLQNVYHTIAAQHAYPPVIRQLLAEALIAAVLLAETIKFDGQLTLQFQSDGPVSLLVAKCDSQGGVRALASWREGVLPINVISALGSGQLVVTVEYDKQVKPYQSIIPIHHQKIAEALEHYFAQSEQLATRIYTAVSPECAAGMLLQLLPAEKDSQEAHSWGEITLLADSLSSQELLTLDNAEILRRLYHEHDLRLFDPRLIEFKCRCSLARMEQAVITLGAAEANQLLQHNKEIVVTCEYCNNHYAFDKNQVAAIFAASQ